MIIEEKTIEYWIDHFYGYGSWEARIWFVAFEEGGGDLPEEVAEKLNYFYRAHGTPETRSKLCDLRELYKHASFTVDGPRAERFTSLYDYRFGREAILHGIWKNLIAFAHGYLDEAVPDLLTYQKKHFALPSKHREALINLYPLPSPHNHAWYYSWLDLPSRFGFLKSRTQYQDHSFERRIGHILTRIGKHKPEVVLMYDMGNINALKNQVQQHFQEVQFKQVKAIKLQIPQHHVANLGGTTLLITTQTPALKHNRVETGFDWLKLGSMIRG